MGAIALHAGLVGAVALDWPQASAEPQEQAFVVELAPDDVQPVLPRQEPPTEAVEPQPVRRSGGDPDLASGASEPATTPESSQTEASEPAVPPADPLDEPATPQLAAVAPAPSRKPAVHERAAVAPTARATPSAPEGQGGGDRYLNLIRDRILSKRDYPAVANPLQLSGVAFFELVLDRAGSLLSLRLVRTSGVGTLDDVGTDMIRRAAPFPPVPEDIAGERLRLSLTLALGPS
jgi:periplasmic protein TonB